MVQRFIFFFGRNRWVISSSRRESCVCTRICKTPHNLQGWRCRGNRHVLAAQGSRYRAAHHRDYISRSTGARRGHRLLITLPLTSSSVAHIHRVRFHLSCARVVPGPIPPAGPIIMTSLLALFSPPRIRKITSRCLDRFPPRDIAILFPRVNEGIRHSMPLGEREREREIHQRILVRFFFRNAGVHQLAFATKINWRKSSRASRQGERNEKKGNRKKIHFGMREVSF